MIEINKTSLDKRLGMPWADTELARALERLPNVGGNGPWVAGGAVRRTITGEPLSTDIDFFFRSGEQYAQFIEDAIGLGSKLVASNTMNTTMKFPAKYDEIIYHADGKFNDHPELKVQAIKFRYYESMED